MAKHLIKAQTWIGIIVGAGMTILGNITAYLWIKYYNPTGDTLLGLTIMMTGIFFILFFICIGFFGAAVATEDRERKEN